MFRNFIRVFALIKKEFIAMLLDSGTRKILILPILVQSILFGYGATFNFNNIPIVIYNEVNDSVSHQIENNIINSKFFDVVAYCRSNKCFKDEISNTNAIAGIYFKSSFKKDKEILIVSDARNTATSNFAVSYLSDLILNSNENYFINHTYYFNPNLVTRYSMLTAMILALVMIQVMMLTSLSLSREKEEGTFDMLLMTPLSTFEIFLGKTIAPAIVAIVQGLTLFAICKFYFKIPFSGNFFSLLSVITLFSFCSVGIGLGISTVTKTCQQSIVISFSITLPAVILSGLLTSIDAMPNWMLILVYSNPLFYGVEALRRIYIEGQSFLDIFHLLVPIFIIGSLISIIAIKMLRHNLN